MPKDISALGISRGIHDAEEGTDALLRTFANLASAMATARLELDLRAAHTQRPLQWVVEAQSKLMEARTCLVNAHEYMYRIAITADIADSCPPYNPLAEAPSSDPRGSRRLSTLAESAGIRPHGGCSNSSD